MNIPHPHHTVRETPRGRVELHPHAELNLSWWLSEWISSNYEGINGSRVIEWFAFNVHGAERNNLITRMHRGEKEAFDTVIQKWKDAEYIRKR